MISICIGTVTNKVENANFSKQTLFIHTTYSNLLLSDIKTDFNASEGLDFR